MLKHQNQLGRTTAVASAAGCASKHGVPLAVFSTTFSMFYTNQKFMFQVLWHTV